MMDINEEHKEGMETEPEAESEKTFQEPESNPEADSGSGVDSMDTEEELEASEKDSAKYDISGEGSTVFDGTNITDSTINQAKGDQYIYDQRTFKSPKEQRFSCPYCFTEVKSKKFGRHTCENPDCKKTFIIKDPAQDKSVVIYTTLLPDEAKKYDKILSHIENYIEEKNYPSAFQYCQKAVELAPGEVSTWMHYALTEFLLEINREAVKRKPTFMIIRSLRTHINKCKNHGMTDDEYDLLVIDIANRLFNIEKARINSVQAKYRDHANNPKWSPFNLNYLQRLLQSFDACYQLYEDTLFLKGYVEELKKEYKWIIKTADGELINTPACGSFDAVKKINVLVEEIQKKEPDYKFPNFAEERFNIKKTQFLKINSVIAKPD